MLQEDDISESLISKCLDSRLSRDPDMLIRTSGENRLSDFLLWQCSSCYIHFDSVLWPEFGYWNLCSAILAFQRNHRKIQQAKRIFTSESKMSERVFQFLSWVESERQSALELMVQ
ncbi:hypothetical protein AB6A40_004656 [Gnathostoma spinigerum]|uniref:ditrans,polycis-polyprenyl diphosphate synthase [(2E,6E)-farnesyldiphosphate specific] n=1 Tax=Gnathostoma spinigerum TaxID=75299 RepID=A0ABD6EN07_9BILA